MPRFALEGKVLNNYGTFKMSDPKFPMYFKVDIVDKHSSDTITVVVGSVLINQFVERLPVGSFVHIEGAAIRRKNKGDGGSSGLSLHVDSTTIVQRAVPFPVHLSFILEATIRQFLNEAASGVVRGAKFCFSTLAFVVVQSENLESKSGSTQGELIVVDGLTSSDRATLTFVTDRKEEYNNLLKEIDCGNLIMRVACNIGAFMGRENTLSVMDLTVLVPVRSKKMQAELTAAFEAQVKSFGYGNEVAGVLSFVNVNSVLIKRVCCVCKSNKVHKVKGGEHCVVCERKIEVLEIPKLQGRICLYDDSVVHAQLIGDIVDRVLHLEKSFQQLYACSVLDTRETLTHASRTGTFKVNIAGHVIGFTEKKT
ncbi:hypothetical protein L7F22_029383 [Adiantum nelumboides]|nr:hypothetical protein [Adiantum nelumboides]